MLKLRLGIVHCAPCKLYLTVEATQCTITSPWHISLKKDSYSQNIIEMQTAELNSYPIGDFYTVTDVLNKNKCIKIAGKLWTNKKNLSTIPLLFLWPGFSAQPGARFNLIDDIST